MEVSANRWLIDLGYAFAYVVLYDACFAYCAVTQHYDFKDVVFLHLRLLQLCARKILHYYSLLIINQNHGVLGFWLRKPRRTK